MSFQYPPPSVGGSDMDMQQAPYLPVYSLPSQHQQPSGVADPRTSQLSMHDSRDPSLSLRRSFSTPNAVPYPGAGLDSAQAGLPGEKKRNKLGYHRSSVACVHCRKRKIRCVPDTNDKQGRCTNCMRLKKDCSFHPVDQASPVEVRGKTSARGPGSQRNPSTSASPAASGGQPSDTPIKRPLSRQILPPGVGQAGISSQDDDDRTSISDTASNGRLAGHSFELSSQRSVAWGTADLHQPMHGKTGDFPGQWQPVAGMNDQFSPYDGLQTSPGWQTDAHGQPPHEGFPWGNMPLPARSMSYSGDAMSGHQQGQFEHGVQGVMYARRASNFTELYNPALGGPVPNVDQGAQHLMDPIRPFPPGSTGEDSILWDSQHGQPQDTFHKPEAYDGWGYGHNSNGHQ